MYSETQAANITAFVGLLVMILNHFKINITSAELQAFLGAAFTLGGIIWNFYHRYKKGDLKLSGVRIQPTE